MCFNLISPLYVPSFSSIEACICIIWQKMQSVWKDRKEKIICLLVSQDWLAQIWYVDLPTLQQIWFDSDKKSQSYIGVKIMFNIFLSIYSWCGVMASWAARHTIVCVDTSIQKIKNFQLEYRDDSKNYWHLKWKINKNQTIETCMLTHDDI